MIFVNKKLSVNDRLIFFCAYHLYIVCLLELRKKKLNRYNTSMSECVVHLRFSLKINSCVLFSITRYSEMAHHG